MLVKLLPEQIAKLWPAVKKMIKLVVPESRLNYVLEQSLLGKIELWFVVRDELPCGFLVTTFEYNDYEDVKSLNIFLVHKISEIKFEDFKDAVEKLKVYAKSKGCKRLITYCDRDGVLRVCQMVGGQELRKMVTFGLD